ncbi:MAG: hypothetical protein NT015_05360 [Alphaproteobacteria bacterium]|nr:hypothetical protein [Alphaproteobacteria bacterium]
MSRSAFLALAALTFCALAAGVYTAPAVAETIPGTDIETTDAASFERLLIARSGAFEQTSGMTFRVNHGDPNGALETVNPVVRISVSLRPAWNDLVPGVNQTLRAMTEGLGPGERIADVPGISTIPIEANVRIEHDDIYISTLNDNGRAVIISNRNRRFETLTFILNCDALQRVRAIQLRREGHLLSLDRLDPVRVPFGPLLFQDSGQRDRFSAPGANITQQSGLFEIRFERLRTVSFDYTGPFWSQGPMEVQTNE